MRYFVDQIITAHDVPKSKATHFAICNGGRTRYYIAIDKAIKKQAAQRLSNNISAYSGKLGMVMKLLGRVPYEVFCSAHIGRFVRLDLDGQVDRAIGRAKDEALKTPEVYWNVIVGSYVEKQKAVFQCFGADSACPAVFLKAGGESSDPEMHNETDYLCDPIRSGGFDNPVLCFSEYRDGNNAYNIQATREFSGDRVEPELTADIVRIYHDISSSKPMTVEDGITMTFSHGDFTPWNMKKRNGRYIVFDWEYCGMRFYGFDLIHYLWQVENKLHGRDNESAMRKALEKAKQADKKLAEIPDDVLGQMYFDELHKQFGAVL